MILKEKSFIKLYSILFLSFMFVGCQKGSQLLPALPSPASSPDAFAINHRLHHPLLLHLFLEPCERGSCESPFCEEKL